MSRTRLLNRNGVRQQMLNASSMARPDITLTMDFDGVIIEAASEALSEERLDVWRGLPWGDTMDPQIAEQVAQSIEYIRNTGESSCFQVKQRFPSGRELAIEYTTVSLGKSAGFIAVGKNIQAISDLQSRLLLAQQARERDYWKIREMETRYRLLFDTTNEAVLSVRAADLHIVEANLAATNLFGLQPGVEFSPDLQPRDRLQFKSLLEKVRERGRAPGIVLHLGPAAESWSLRASLMNSDAGSFYLFHIAPIVVAAAAGERKGPLSADDLVQRLPEGFVVVDRRGAVLRANNAFLDLSQIGTESAALGQNMGRWLSQPGADFSVLLTLLRKHGSVRLMSTKLYGELGSTTDVEISAAGNKDLEPDYIGMLLRDVTTRSPPDPGAMPISELNGNGDISLEHLVRASTEAIERQSIAAALEKAAGNRTAAAKILRLSRQSLHTKLNKYDIKEN
jgi:transcriptional regulator PpsR